MEYINETPICFSGKHFGGKFHNVSSYGLPKLFRAATLFKRDSNLGSNSNSSEICNNFQNTYLQEHLWTTTFECYYNGGKILRNTSTSWEDCFLGTVKSDRKKRIFFYH